jgi:hypothetical protein
VCFIARKMTAELECVIFTTLYFTGGENTDKKFLMNFQGFHVELIIEEDFLS